MELLSLLYVNPHLRPQRPFSVKVKCLTNLNSQDPALFRTDSQISVGEVFNERCFTQKAPCRFVMREAHFISPSLCWTKQMDQLTQRTILRDDRWRDMFN